MQCMCSNRHSNTAADELADVQQQEQAHHQARVSFGLTGHKFQMGGGETGEKGGGGRVSGNTLADPSDHDGADSHALCSQQHPPLPIVPQGGSRGHVLPYQLSQVRLGYRQQPCTCNSAALILPYRLRHLRQGYLQQSFTCNSQHCSCIRALASPGCSYLRK